jgi:eukaryotic-like serine/threonine-protein kinase
MCDESSIGEREEHLNRVIAAYLEAQRLGQSPDRDSFMRDHPDLADELRSFFGDQDHFGRLAAPIALPAEAAPSPAGMPTLDLDRDAGSGPVPLKVRYFGDYELLEELARGGMGVVYRARQVSLNRTVAVKMILAGHFASPEDVRRFHREAEAAANLDHPHIVPVHEVGEHQGHHYFSMKLVEGGSLADRALPWPARLAVSLVATVARAVHHAHQRGVLHRDLKPGNILLDAQDRPYVTDFGLARHVEGQNRQTGTGAILGTASYMPPEQARAEKVVTVGVDVYSLGAILYELLTGRPPFRAATPMETVQQVLDRDPEPPHRVDSRIDRDLETICLKCLEKDPQKRYDSAAALADDLERWQNGSPIVARPVTASERVIKWARRRPAAAALIGVSLAALCALLILGLSYEARLRSALGQVDQVRHDADNDRAAARKDRDDARERLTRAEGLLYTAESSTVLPTNPTLAMLLAIEGAQRLPGLQSNQALQAALDTCQEERTLLGHTDAVLAVAFSPDSRGLLTASRDGTARLWETDSGQLQHVLTGHEGAVTCAAFSPDGRRALTLAPGPDRSAIIWDAATGAKLARLKLSSKWDVRFQAPGPGDPPSLEFLTDYNTASFSPDGRLVITAFGEYPDMTVRVWDADSGTERTILKGHEGPVGSANFSPDGNWIVTASLDGTARIWEAGTGRQVHVLRGLAGGMFSASFSPDGRRVLTVDEGRKFVATPAEGYHPTGVDGNQRQRSAPGAARIWDAATGREVARLKWSQWVDGIARRAAYSPDGRRVVTAGWRYLSVTGGLNPPEDLQLVKPCGVPRIWEAVTGRQIHVLDGPQGDEIRTFAFSPDGKRLVTAGAGPGNSFDRSASVWDLITGAELATLRGHDGPVVATAFSPDGRHIATASADRTARLWKAPHAPSPGRPWLAISRASLSSDGRRLVGTSGDRIVLQDVATGQEICELRKNERIIHGGSTMADAPTSLRFSPDGRRILILSWLRQLAWIHDVATGKELVTLRTRTRTATEFGFRSAEFSRDGRRVVAVSVGGKGHVFDVSTGKEQVVLEGGSPAMSASFSRDGRRILTSPRLVPTPGGITILGPEPISTAPNIWEADTGRLLMTLLPSQPRPADECTGAEFSTDGQRVVGVYADGAVRIWDAGSGRELVVIRGHAGKVSGAIFSPDGRRVLTGSHDRTARIWDAVTGTAVVRLKGHESGVGAGVQEIVLAVSSPDGRRIVTGESHGTARLWDAATGQQLAVWKGPSIPVCSAVFSDDRCWVLIGYLSSEAECWLRPVDPLAAAVTRKARDLTAEEKQRYRAAGPFE